MEYDDVIQIRHSITKHDYDTQFHYRTICWNLLYFHITGVINVDEVIPSQIKSRAIIFAYENQEIKMI